MKLLVTENNPTLANFLHSQLKARGVQVEIIDENAPFKHLTDTLIDPLFNPHSLSNDLETHTDQLNFGNTTLDLAHSMLLCGDRSVRLSSHEFDVMCFLLHTKSRNLSKEAILARVWGYDSDAVGNHVEVYVGFLRKKLKKIGSNIQIKAIRGLGYHLEVNETD